MLWLENKMSERKYLYCFIKCPYEKEFAVGGIGGSGNRVHTINYRDLAAVVSDAPQIEELKLNKENTTTHELVINAVLKDFTVLPVGFGCVTDSAHQIKEKVLKPNFDQLEQLLREMDGKIELILKALWKDNRILHQEILKVTPGIKNRVNKLFPTGKTGKRDPGQMILSAGKLGKRLIQATDKVKKCYTDEFVAPLEQLALDKRFKKLFTPLMICNVAFLVIRDKEEEFEKAVDDLDRKYGQDIKFIYSGPSAPYSFVDFRIALA